MFQTDLVEQSKTHILYSVKFPPPTPENLAFYEIMWRNIVERGRPQMTIWRMRIACWKPKACVIFIAFPLQQWIHERVSLLCYTYVACRVIF